jgi:uncharacterized membrane protein YfcA
LYVLVGVLAGGVGTLVGAGGAVVLVPVLLLFAGDKAEVKHPQLLTAVSMALVLANAASGSAAYAKMRRIDIKSALLFAAVGVPGTIIGTEAVRYVQRSAFELAFGVLMIGVSIYIFLKPHRSNLQAGKHAPPGHAVRTIIDRDGNEYHYTFNLGLGLAISVGVGFLAGFLGIGGGIIHVPAMTQLLNFPVHVATASSHLVLAIMAMVATITHIANGDFTPGVIWMVIPLAAGAIVGAQLGAEVSKKLKGALIVRILAIALCSAGVRIFIFGISGLTK